MTVELLISTMHQDDHSLLDKMNVRSDAVVINQCDTESSVRFIRNGFVVRWVNTTERGLSKSRNMALRYATAEICMLADDDMVYRDGYAETVSAAFEKTGADILRFMVHGIEAEFKKYPAKECAVTRLRSMQAASVELAFKRLPLVASGAVFDERIGAGTKYLMGEESALLFDCLRKHLSIRFVPEVIADLHIGNSTWNRGYTDDFFIAKGAAFAAMKTPLTRLLILQWALRKSKRYKGASSVGRALLLMEKGRRAYRRECRNDT